MANYTTATINEIITTAEIAANRLHEFYVSDMDCATVNDNAQFDEAMVSHDLMTLISSIQKHANQMRSSYLG